MDNTEKARQLLNKHLNIHGGDSLGITDGNVYRAVIDAIDEALQQTPTERSAYYVHITGQGETCVVAKNINEAMDKIERLTAANYTFIFSRSLPCII